MPVLDELVPAGTRKAERIERVRDVRMCRGSSKMTALAPMWARPGQAGQAKSMRPR